MSEYLSYIFKDQVKEPTNIKAPYPKIVITKKDLDKVAGEKKHPEWDEITRTKLTRWSLIIYLIPFNTRLFVIVRMR